MKESASSVGDLGLIPGSGKSPGEWNGNPFQYSWLENPHGQRSLVGYSPRGRKESDTTEVTQHNIPLSPTTVHKRHILGNLGIDEPAPSNQ